MRTSGHSNITLDGIIKMDKAMVWLALWIGWSKNISKTVILPLYSYILQHNLVGVKELVSSKVIEEDSEEETSIKSTQWELKQT